MGKYVADKKPDCMPSYECHFVHDCDDCDFKQKFWREEYEAKKEEQHRWYCSSCRAKRKQTGITVFAGGGNGG